MREKTRKTENVVSYENESSKDAFYLAGNPSVLEGGHPFWKIGTITEVLSGEAAEKQAGIGGSPPPSRGLWGVWPLEPQLLLTIPVSEPPFTSVAGLIECFLLTIFKIRRCPSEFDLIEIIAQSGSERGVTA